MSFAEHTLKSALDEQAKARLELVRADNARLAAELRVAEVLLHPPSLEWTPRELQSAVAVE